MRRCEVRKAREIGRLRAAGLRGACTLGPPTIGDSLDCALDNNTRRVHSLSSSPLIPLCSPALLLITADYGPPRAPTARASCTQKLIARFIVSFVPRSLVSGCDALASHVAPCRIFLSEYVSFASE